MFMLLSFSSAIHLLRTDAHLGQRNLADTIYNLFASALTTGDFMAETSTQSNNNKDYIPWLQAIFATYLCCTAIILLNILISMINSRYDERRKVVRNIWTFQTLRTWVFLHGVGKLFWLNLKCSYILRLYYKWTKRIPCSKTRYEYDKVSITEDGDKIFLHVKYRPFSKKHDNRQTVST